MKKLTFWQKIGLFPVKPLEDNDEKKEVTLPAFNWFVHVLAENVGKVTWRKRSKEERCNSDLTIKDYPYIAVEHPIPDGTDIVLECSKKYTIKCDSIYTRNLIIKLATEYVKLEKENQFWLRENNAEKWIPVELLESHHECSSAPDHYSALVTSPTLFHMGGTFLGHRTEGKWFVLIGEKYVEHQVTHYRNLPPGMKFDYKYEDVKDEVDRLDSIRFKDRSWFKKQT